jgi:putative spermidine/putrescine transport system ATP-binding protein
MTTVTIKNLIKRYGAFPALKGCNLTVESGKLVTLLGPSGCGKTTLLRTIAGISSATDGEIRFGDRLMNDVPAERRNIGMVFQTYALFPHMTVARNLAFGLEMRRVPRAEMASRIERALKLVELDEQASRYPRQLSGGQQQRVALARAIVIEPDVLLFDEPLSNLDARLRETLRDDLKALQRNLGVTAVYVTHDQAEAMALADHIVVMRKGEIVEQGDPESLYRKPRFRYTAEFLGNTNIVPATFENGGVRLPWGALRPTAFNAGHDPKTALVSLRPEDLTIRGGRAPSSETVAIVRDITFLGADVRYAVEIGGVQLRVQQSGANATVLPPGTEVQLELPGSVHTVLDDSGIGNDAVRALA